MSDVLNRQRVSTPDRPTLRNIILNDVNLYYSESSDALQVYNKDVIHNMIDNILFTIIGERHFEPEFGSDLLLVMWRQCDEITAWECEASIVDALKRWMPYIRVSIGGTNVTLFDGRDGFNVRIEYVYVRDNIRDAYITSVSV